MEFLKATDKEISTENDKPLRVGVLRAHNSALSLTSSLNLMAYMAKNFNIELYFFTLQDINFENNTVNSVLIEGNTRTPQIIPLPKMIYNTYGWYKNADPKKKNLLQKKCFLVRSGVKIGKQKIYDRMFADERFKDFLIETHTIKNFEHFLSLFRRYENNVVLKPQSGMQGSGIFKIAFDAENYVVYCGNTKTIRLTAEEFKKLYEKTFAESGYLLQPYIASRTKYGNPFDIRIHARRGAEGKFYLFPYPRVGGNPQGILSNLSAGGYTMPLNKFLVNEFGSDWQMLYDKIIDLGNTLPDYVQSTVNNRLSALGIDVGIQRRGDSYELKIFEINISSPGVSAIRIEAAFTDLLYMQYLGKCLAEGTLEKNL